jgi:hypothetical protein
MERDTLLWGVDIRKGRHLEVFEDGEVDARCAGSTRVREQDRPTPPRLSQDPIPEPGLVEDIGRQQQVPLIRRLRRGANLEAIVSRIECCGASREGIEIEGDDIPRTRPRGRQGGDPRSSAEIDDALATNPFGMVEQEACESLAAAPAECPEGWGLAVEKFGAARFEIDGISKQPELELGTQREASRIELRSKCTEMIFELAGQAEKVRQRPIVVSTIPSTITRNPRPPRPPQTRTPARSSSGIRS